MIREKINQRLPTGVRLGYGTIYLFTTEPPAFIEKAARWKYINRWHDIGISTFFMMMLSGWFVLLFTAWTTIKRRPEPTAVQEPANLVAVPGVNEFLPLSAAPYIVLALITAAALHEIAHGIAMQAEGITLTEIGIGCLVFFPIAAYVMPDEAEFKALSARSRARVLAAGVFANFLTVVITSILFVLLGVGALLNAFVVYFGLIFGLGGPTPSDIAALGPVINSLFWMWFFNLNLAFLNALPVMYLDGGRIVSLATEYVDPQCVYKPWIRHGIVSVGTMSSLTLFGTAVFGPLLL